MEFSENNSLTNKIPLDFQIPKRDDLVFNHETKIYKTEAVFGENKKIAWMERGYNRIRKEYYLLDSHFDEGVPKWIEDVPVPLVKGKGIPLSLYLELRAMKLLEIPKGGIDYFIIYNIHEWDSLFELTSLTKKDKSTEINILVKKTRLFQSRLNSIIQSGNIIEDIKIDVENAMFSHPKSLVEFGLKEIQLAQLSEKFKISQVDLIFWNFSIIIKVKKIF